MGTSNFQGPQYHDNWTPIMKILLAISFLAAAAFAVPATSNEAGQTTPYLPFELWQDNGLTTANGKTWVLAPTPQAPKGARAMLIEMQEEDDSELQTFTVTVKKNVEVERPGAQQSLQRNRAPAGARSVTIASDATQLLQPLDLPVEKTKLLLANGSSIVRRQKSNIPQATEQIGKQIGGPIGVAIGSAIGSAIGKAIGGPIGLAIGNALVSLTPG